MAILSSSDYPAVRAALDTSIDENVLPDSVIEYPQFKGLAEAEVLSWDANAETRTGTEAVRIKVATILFTAYYLALSVPNIIREQFPSGESYGREQINWNQRCAWLKEQALCAIEDVVSTKVRTFDQFELHYLTDTETCFIKEVPKLKSGTSSSDGTRLSDCITLVNLG